MPPNNQSLLTTTEGDMHGYFTPNPIFCALYQSWSDRMAANPAMTLADLRSLFDEVASTRARA